MKYLLRHPRPLRAFLILAGLALAVPAGIFAQAGNASLRGRITDASGAALPGSTVTAKNPTTGFSRSITSAGDGAYSFPSLPPGSYDVTFEMSGFKTIDAKDVVLQVATVRQLDVTMEVSAVAEMMTVSSETPVVRTEAAMGAVISQKELSTLPLNGRQFANVAILAPGTQLSYNSDPTKPGQLTIALDGGSGRNVNFVIDGGDNTDDTIGGALQNYPLESVQEFKIQTQEYKAEYGRSSGGVLNVVTKGGTNDFHGGIFEYFRDKSLNSETESEKQGGGGKQDYRRNQYGASIGGPIMKDRAHFFLTAERTEQRTNYIVNSGDLPGIDGTAVPLPFRDELLAGKLSFDISATQYLQVRFGYQKNSQKYGQGSSVAPDGLGTVSNKYSSLLLGHQMQVGSTGYNELLFQYTKFENGITPDSNNPTIYFGDGTLLGQNPNTPQHTLQTKYQYKDDFAYAANLFDQSHDLKFGINYIHEPVLEGDFSTGTVAPIYTLSGNSIDSHVTDITQFGGFLGQKTPVNEFSAYVQDDWRPTPRLTVNVGLRYDLWLGFDLNQSSNPIYQTLSTQTQYNDASYYNEFRGWDGKLKNDKKNWGPRFGFNYDLTGSNHTFVHGGWGIYYDFPYVNATLLFPASAVQSDYGVSYNVHDDNGILNPDGSFFQVGQPLPANQGGSTSAPNEVAAPNLTKTPFSRQASLGVSHQVTDWLGLALDGSYIQYRDIPFRFRANPIDPATGQRRFEIDGQHPNFRIWTGGGQADYKGISLSFNARLSEKLRMQGFYTLSKADGNVLLGADEFRITGVDAQPDIRGASLKDVSINPLDPNCSACSGPLYTDARHKVTLAAVYTAPWQVNVSGVLRYRSALPYMKFDNVDYNGDGYNLDLLPGHHANEGRGHSFEQFDLAFAKEFPIGPIGIEVIAQVFNVFNAKNPALYDRTGTPNAYAGDPFQGEQRLLQLGAKVHF
jgi:Carboxypeptidase regulatory-like domain/TonB dependent receptor